MSSLLPNKNLKGGITCSSSFSRVNPDTNGCVCTAEFDLNTLRVDGEIFAIRKEKAADSKIRRKSTLVPRDHAVTRSHGHMVHGHTATRPYTWTHGKIKLITKIAKSK